MRVFDCFMYNNEIDILLIRLEELYPVVDKFIIVEGSHTFQGTPREDYGKFLEDPRIGRYLDKLCGINIDLSENIGPWEREYKQRNGITEALEHEKPDANDIVLISDADEIPRRSVIRTLDPQPIQSIGLDVYYYGLNVKSDQLHTIRAVRYSELLSHGAQTLRTLDPPPAIVYDGGWHFSYLGPVERIVDKFQSFAHAELNRPDTTDPEVLKDRMSGLRDLWGDGHTYERVEIDDTWPEAVKLDREYWSVYEY